MAERFFSPVIPRAGRIRLEGDESRHLVRVCRLGCGDVVEVFDGGGFATRAEVTAVGKDWVELQAVGAPVPDRATPCRLTLATAVPKGERFDWLVEKATELGVTRLLPLLTERSVVDPRTPKLDRLRRRIIEASKQCGRNRLMVLDPPVSWTDWLATPSAEAVRLVAHPGGIPPRCWPRAERGREAVLAIGPEGGFTDQETTLACAAGWQLASLGPNLLRIETAALAACAAILALGGGWDA